MAFEFNPLNKKRLQYEAGGTVSYKFPAGNIFAAMNLLANLKVNITTAISSNAPDFQIFNAIQKVEILQNTDSVWSLSGTELAMLFSQYRGVTAEGNTTIAGAVANGVTAQHFLKCPFYPRDALKPWDFAIDTRKHDYELQITWRDLSQAGALFGTVGGEIVPVDAECYIDVELENLILRPNPATGAPDALSAASPLLMGIQSKPEEVNSDNPAFAVEVPKHRNFRNMILWTTHHANTKQEVGVNTVLTDKILVTDTQGRIYQNRRAKFVRESTSQEWGVGSNLPAGVYDVPLTKFGSAADKIVADNITELLTEMAVEKLANLTRVRAIFITQDNQ